MGGNVAPLSLIICGFGGNEGDGVGMRALQQSHSISARRRNLSVSEKRSVGQFSGRPGRIFFWQGSPQPL